MTDKTMKLQLTDSTTPCSGGLNSPRRKRMSRYIVTRKEIWNQGVQIEADSKEEAIRKVEQGEGDVIETLFEYNTVMDPDNWNIEEWHEETDG